MGFTFRARWSGMASKQNPDLDRKMLTLTQMSIFIGVLGIIVGAIIGIMQLKGSSSAPQVVKEKTIIYRESDKSSGTSAQPSNQPSAKPVTQSVAHTAAAHKSTGDKAVSDVAEHTAASTPKPEPKSEPKPGTKPADPASKPAEPLTPATGGDTTTPPSKSIKPPFVRFPGGIHVLKPAGTATTPPAVNTTQPPTTIHLNPNIKLRKTGQ